MFLNRVQTVVCCAIVFGLLLLTPELAGQGVEPAYRLPVGTQVVFETSASGTLPGRSGVLTPVSATVVSSFTVLRTDKGIHTILASVGASERKTEDQTSRSAEQRQAFTFEMAEDGEVGRFAGRLGTPFPGWSPELYFPPVPETSGIAVTLPLPLFDASFRTSASREMRDGLVTLSARVQDASPAGGMPLVIKDYRWTADHESSVGMLRSSKLDMLLTMPTDSEEVREAHLAFDTLRLALTTLEPGAVSALQEDAAAGIALITQLQGTQTKAGASDLADAIQAYLQKHPTGEFAALFGDIATDLKSLKQLQENFERLRPGIAAPDFRATDIDGNPVALADYKGKVVLLDFWASWCPPCVMSKPDLKRLYEQYAEKGFSIIGISGDHEREALQRFVQRMNLPWKQIWESQPTSGTVRHLYGVTRFPTLVLLDQNGVIKGLDLHGQDLERAVSDLLKQSDQN